MNTTFTTRRKLEIENTIFVITEFIGTVKLESKKIAEWMPDKKRSAGRPRLRWMDQVEEDLKRMKIIVWRAKVEDRQEWNC